MAWLVFRTKVDNQSILAQTKKAAQRRLYYQVLNASRFKGAPGKKPENHLPVMDG